MHLRQEAAAARGRLEAAPAARWFASGKWPLPQRTTRAIISPFDKWTTGSGWWPSLPWFLPGNALCGGSCFARLA